ncbi:hypothetical protein H0H87_012980 [Tephrocybe sp. NHM501043]|nr:hypothetical protein H0H87_012980 [Tephrocybe sp. NHM501043]
MEGGVNGINEAMEIKKQQFTAIAPQPPVLHQKPGHDTVQSPQSWPAPLPVKMEAEPFNTPPPVFVATHLPTMGPENPNPLAPSPPWHVPPPITYASQPSPVPDGHLPPTWDHTSHHCNYGHYGPPPPVLYGHHGPSPPPLSHRNHHDANTYNGHIPPSYPPYYHPPPSAYGAYGMPFGTLPYYPPTSAYPPPPGAVIPYAPLQQTTPYAARIWHGPILEDTAATNSEIASRALSTIPQP